MNFLKIETNSYHVCRLPHSTTKVNLERRMSFFSLKIVTTNDNNLKLESFLKIFTKPSRILVSRHVSLNNYKSLILKI